MLRTTGQFLVEQIRVEVPGDRFGVDETWPRPDVADRESAGTEGEIAHQDLVARAHPHSKERQVQSRRSARQGRYRAGAGELGQLRLERLDVGSGGSHPT